MHHLSILEPVDYLVIGHITIDLTPTGPRLGGTAAYSALTAQALGLRVGVVTSWGAEIQSEQLLRLPIINYPTDKSSTFENLYTPEGRVQVVHNTAPQLDFHMVPEPWRNAKIVHLGPVAQEVEPSLVRYFPSALLCLTPQGWLRAWDENGYIGPAEWPEASFLLSAAGAVVLSVEDVYGDEERIEEMVSAARVIAVTEGAKGSRVYWNGDVRRFRRSPEAEVDSTGAGDIYATAFFARMYATSDPWEAARFATMLAGYSVTRPGLDGVPTAQEIEESMVEVF